MKDILIPDPTDFDALVAIAESLSSFVKSELIDVTDVSYSVDEYGIFTFENSNDAMLFKLKCNV